MGGTGLLSQPQGSHGGIETAEADAQYAATQRGIEHAHQLEHSSPTARSRDSQAGSTSDEDRSRGDHATPGEKGSPVDPGLAPLDKQVALQMHGSSDSLSRRSHDEPLPYKATVRDLFRYATKWDLFWNAIGILAACAAGAAQPLMTIGEQAAGRLWCGVPG